MKIIRMLVFSLMLTPLLGLPVYAQGEYYLNSDGEMELLYDAYDGDKLTQDGKLLIKPCCQTDKGDYRGDQYLRNGRYEYYRPLLGD